MDEIVIDKFCAADGEDIQRVLFSTERHDRIDIAVDLESGGP